VRLTRSLTIAHIDAKLQYQLVPSHTNLVENLKDVLHSIAHYFYQWYPPKTFNG
jgi:hypothetical protein